MNPVFERINELIPVIKLNRITMNQITDYQGLFNSLAPIECSVCTNQATREVKYITPTGKAAIILVCDRCFDEPDVWEGRKIIQTTHL